MNEENNNFNINKKNNIDFDFDKYEFYSYTIYLYGYAFFYLFIFEQKLIQALFLNILFNFLLKKTINHNIFDLILHKYWKKNLNDIAMPQLISCVSGLVTYNYNNYFSIPLNLIIFYFIKKIYKKEIRYSRNLRIIILFLFCINKIIF
jgi:hypothetical protein